MASKIKVTPQKEEVPEKEGPETPPDSPLLDLSNAAVKKLIRSAKKRGYVTVDQINALLFSEEVKYFLGRMFDQFNTREYRMWETLTDALRTGKPDPRSVDLHDSIRLACSEGGANTVF